MKNLSCFIITFLMAGALFCQNLSHKDMKEIKGSINELFEGMQKADTIQLNKVLAENIKFQSFDFMSEPARNIETTRKEFYNGLIKLKESNFNWKEELTDYQFLNNKEFVCVWTPYIFYLNGNKNHCGINQFNLIKQGQIWVIHSVYDTRRKCN